MYIKKSILDVIEGRRRSPVMEPILSLLSVFYKSAIMLRHIAYDRKWLKTYKALAPVISIGNIAAGGVGKTPVVKKLAEEFSKKKKVAILTRGYKSSVEKTEKSLKWNGESAFICGDEPFWLASHLPQVDVWIGKDRVQSAQLAYEEGAELLLLDDGMQHRRLVRDADVVVLDGKDLWSGKKFLPRGLLRDFPERLKGARLVIVMQINSAEELETLRPSIERYTRAPIVGTRLVVKTDLRGKRVGVFCAIGKPERFLRTVQELEGEVVTEMLGLDHQFFEKKILEDFALRSREKGAELLVCTEKDGVKLSRGINSCLPILSLPASMEIVAGEEHWKALVEEYTHDGRI